MAYSLISERLPTSVTFHLVALQWRGSPQTSWVMITHYCFTVLFIPPLPHCNSSFIHVTVVIYYVVLFAGGQDWAILCNIWLPCIPTALHWSYFFISLDRARPSPGSDYHRILTSSIMRQQCSRHDSMIISICLPNKKRHLCQCAGPSNKVWNKNANMHQSWQKCRLCFCL